MNENIVMKFQKICRTCVVEKENLQTIFHVIDVLKECTSIQVNVGDGLPELICVECLDRLNNAFEFRKQCEISDKTLKQLSGVGEISVKSEYNVTLNDQPLIDDNHIENIEVDVDIKSENSYNKNEFDLNDTCDVIQSDEDSEDEPLIQRLNKQNKNNTGTFTSINVKSEKTDFDSNKLSREIKEKFNKQNINDESSSIKNRKNRRKQNTITKKSEKDKIQVTPQEGTPCSECTECFELESDLELHMILHQKALNCTKCSISFKTRRSFTRHVRQHMTIKPYRCTLCPKGFTESSYYVRHLRVHTGEKPYICSTCGKRYSDSSGLSAHMKYHSDVKSFICTVCSKSFKFPFELRTHMRVHTGEKPFLCTVCGDSFTQAYAVTQHMRKHTGERPYACTECGRKFRLNVHLKYHMRIHTGYKPYVCKICEIGFARPDVLVIHSRSHTGERPYACNVCEKKFISSSDLAQHRRTHNKEKKLKDLNIF